LKKKTEQKDPKEILRDIEKNVRKRVRDLRRAVKEYRHFLKELKRKYGKLDGFDNMGKRMDEALQKSAETVATCVENNRGYDEAVKQTVELHRITYEQPLTEKVERKIGKRKSHELRHLSHNIGNKCSPVVGWVQTLEAERKEFKISK
jgi:sugar-specific transcriptional regulator TrmB